MHCTVALDPGIYEHGIAFAPSQSTTVSDAKSCVAVHCSSVTIACSCSAVAPWCCRRCPWPPSADLPCAVGSAQAAQVQETGLKLPSLHSNRRLQTLGVIEDISAPPCVITCRTVQQTYEQMEDSTALCPSSTLVA